MTVCSPLFIFGLSGVGKTTLVENVCRDKRFFLPKQVVTRAPRPDDNIKKYEYVSKKKFQDLSAQKKFFLECDDGVNCYGYKKSSLSRSRVILLYGIPSELEMSRRIGLCILIQGNASRGLAMRGDSQGLVESRKKINVYLQEHYYANPVFQKKMDLILTNEFGKVDCMVILFKQFIEFKQAEQKAFRDHPFSLWFVLKTYHQPLKGMRVDFKKQLFWVQKAFQNELLRFLFYSKVIRESRLLISYNPLFFKRAHYESISH